MDGETKLLVRRAVIWLIGAWAIAVAVTFAVVFATRAVLRHW